MHFMCTVVFTTILFSHRFLLVK